MSLTWEQMYALMPATYRIRDAGNGYPMRALFQVLATQSGILEDNIQQLYDDQFIETCAPWVIPYIGELIGYDAIYEISGALSDRRAEVANTIGYRRRKGTLLALEQVCHDVSGMPTCAVEFFRRLITTESMHLIRPDHAATVDLRHGGQLERVGTAFDTLNRTVDVRRIVPRVRTISDPDFAALDINLHGEGKFNIPEVGVYLWRWQPFQVIQAAAYPVSARRFMFSPLGQNMPLFNDPPARDSFSSLTTRLDVPQPISRREFSKRLGDFYGRNSSVALYADGVLIDPNLICCSNLEDRIDGDWGCTPSGKVSIDPKLGRIQFAPDFDLPKLLQVSYSYGFPANIGGGPYNRTSNLPQFALDQMNVQVVGKMASPTVKAAIANWNGLPPGSKGMIVLPGFASFDIDLTGAHAIVLKPQSQLWIISAQENPTQANAFDFEGSLAVLRGSIEVKAHETVSQEAKNALTPGQLCISGLWLAGTLTVAGGAGTVQLSDSTLVPGIALERSGRPAKPGAPSITVSADEVTLTLIGCITGPIGASIAGATRICSSIVDSGSRCAVAYAAEDLDGAGADLHVEETTIFGKVRTRTMELASNTLFLAALARRDTWKAALWCSRQQVGCVRFCFLPASFVAPQQFRCLPTDSKQEGALRPWFVSTRYGDPSYGLLSGTTPMAVWTGADNGSQVGVYYILQETQAVRNVQLRAGEYVPFGMETGVFLVPDSPEIVHAAVLPYEYGLQHDSWDPCEGSDEDDLQFIGIGVGLV